jgi:hypothetical protein
MRFAPLCAALVLLCSCATTPLRLERYRGVYSTHFEGIPDRAEACALVHNTGTTPVDWVELSLVATSRFDGAERAFRSRWLYRTAIAPGGAVALRFVHPPFADELEVTLARAGSGAPTRPGRPLVAAAECSDEALRAVLAEQVRDHTAPGIELRSSARTTPDSDAAALVAVP